MISSASNLLLRKDTDMKKIIALMLVMAISLSLFGCELLKKEEDPKEQTPTVNTPETPENNEPTDEEKYQNALALIKSGKCKEAYDILKALGDYKDAKTLLTKFRMLPIYYKDTDGTMVGTEFVPDEYEVTEAVIGANGIPTKVTLTYSDGDVDAYEISFDENGRPVNIVNYYLGRFYEKIVITYDEKGYTSKLESKDADGNAQYSIERKYDANGNLTDYILEFPNGSTDRRTYEYDSENRITKMLEIDNESYDNAILTEWVYDANGNLVKEIFGSYNGPRYYYEYEYDNEGKLIGETIFNGMFSYVTYYYDENGNLARSVTEPDGNEGVCIIDTYIYDDNGNLIEKIHDRKSVDGSAVLYEVHEYTYNADGLVVRDHLTSTNYLTPGRDYECVYEYEYDEYGNVIRELSNYDGDVHVEEFAFGFVFFDDAIDEYIIEFIFEY